MENDIPMPESPVRLLALFDEAAARAAQRESLQRRLEALKAEETKPVDAAQATGVMYLVLLWSYAAMRTTDVDICLRSMDELVSVQRYGDVGACRIWLVLVKRNRTSPRIIRDRLRSSLGNVMDIIVLSVGDEYAASIRTSQSEVSDMLMAYFPGAVKK